MDAEVCECPICGRMHKRYPFGTPPDSILKNAHAAIDWLMASLIAADPTFMPSKSPIWETVVALHEILKRGEG